MTEYRVFAQNEKYGLFYGKRVALEGVYSSIQIIDEDPALEDLLSLEALRKLNDAWAPTISEMDFAILNVDGKVGLVSGGQILLEFKYERIIKLSYAYYLCQEGAKYTLHMMPDPINNPYLELLPTIYEPGELTLEKLLCALAQEYPKAHEALSKYLYKDPKRGTYISEYQHWLGRVGYHCIFPTVAIQKVRMDNDFGVTLLEIETIY
jgi:hypothetical protein